MGCKRIGHEVQVAESADLVVLLMHEEPRRRFCSVVDAGGISRAADKLGISTSSVTNQVSALEAHFQFKLLNRTTSRMSVTDERLQCYDMALALQMTARPDNRRGRGRGDVLIRIGELQDSSLPRPC